MTAALWTATAATSDIAAHAESDAHQVTYTIRASAPAHIDVYYLDHEPAVFADWSHNPYQFMPKFEAEVGPAQPWSATVTLSNPDQWAVMTARIPMPPADSTLSCELAVNGVIRVSNSGSPGVLCSIRHW